MRYVFELLLSQKEVGIDRIIEDENTLHFSNLKERFEKDEDWRFIKGPDKKVWH